MLKIAAVDKNWLQQLVLSERRRLAGLHHAALVKVADQSPNDPEGYAVEIHEEGLAEGEKTYETVLDIKVGSNKSAAELNVNEAGDPPNTSRATQDHAYELEQLAKQMAAMTGGKTEWDPNDMLLD